MIRKFYACQCFFKKGIDAVNMAFGKTIYVFTSLHDRNEFIASKANENEFYAVSQKQAFKIVDLNKATSVPCVYSHAQDRNLAVLADIKQCYGSVYLPLKEFA